jgi:hypothetical protein
MFFPCSDRLSGRQLSECQAFVLDDGGEWNPPCCGGYANFEADGDEGGCEGVVGEAAE